MKHKIGLICEGGGTKGAYTSGALKALVDHDLLFPYCVGISAGAENLLPYVSRQSERFAVTGIGSASNPGAIGWRPLLKEHGLFGIEETCRYIEEHAPLDYKAFYESDTKLDIGLYDIEAGKVEYFSKDYLDEKQTLVKAACALLMLAKPYQFHGKMYMDAGLVDMISIEQSIRAGNDKHIFISTKEENYVRKPAPNWQIFLAKILYRNYPHVARDLKVRHLNYEKQWAKVKALEKEGKALVLRPSADYGISRYTNDREKLAPWFQLGYDDTVARLDVIKKFINE
ncbi:MAG: patatin family protein [Erysipelotrichia bacterium]|nr:patatin family protein [Erysipelotrichia bacterium]NCC54979.1 patatin family protein [Erysipelotrichia bacterium]